MTWRRRQHLYLLPNALTGLSLLIGLWAIMFTIDGIRNGNPEALVIASWWVIIAGLMDGLDGAVARKTKTTSNFGAQFDSLADLVTFGVAPAVILYATIHPWHPHVATGVAATHAMAGAVRLARFNISLIPGQMAKKRSFQGLPIPAAAGVLVALVLSVPHLERLLGAETSRRLLPAAALVCAYLMISKIRFATLQELLVPAEDNPLSIAGRVAALGVLVLLIRFLPNELCALIALGGYVIFCVAAAAVWRWRLLHQARQR